MMKLPYPFTVLLLMVALALLFHIIALTTSLGTHLPIMAGYITAVLVALYSLLNHHFYKTSKHTESKRIMNVILISKICRMFFFLLLFLGYCLIGEKIKGYAVELVCMFFVYLAFDTVYLVKMQNEKITTNQ